MMRGNDPPRVRRDIKGRKQRIRKQKSREEKR